MRKLLAELTQFDSRDADAAKKKIAYFELVNYIMNINVNNTLNNVNKNTLLAKKPILSLSLSS